MKDTEFSILDAGFQKADQQYPARDRIQYLGFSISNPASSIRRPVAGHEH